jgi:hypothetical protein
MRRTGFTNTHRPVNLPSGDDDGIFEIKLEYVLPFFVAVLVALNLCAFITLRSFPVPQAASPVPAETETLQPEPFEGLSTAFLHEPEPVQDLAAEYYRDPLSRDLVTEFFSRLSGSREIAGAILDASETFNISPSLAFALSWEESRYFPRAVNRRNLNGSVDRGLFQLNNRSFPKLTEAEFFDPRINTWNGIAHLRWCLDSGGSELIALSMYNAGSGRVNADGTPKKTLEYVDRVLASRRKIDSLFEAEVPRLAAHAALLSAATETGDIPDSEAAGSEDDGLSEKFERLVRKFL